MEKAKLNRIGYITAALTFIVGAFIMYAHYQGFKGDYERWGILFIPIAAVINLIVLAYILVVASKYSVKGKLRGIGAMLLNIPFAIFCLWFALYLYGYYRVTIVNDTGSRITAIELFGCDQKKIESLQASEEETVWIKLERDCSLNISFHDSRGEKHEDNVAGYLCSGMGQKGTYHLSGNSNPRY